MSDSAGPAVEFSRVSKTFRDVAAVSRVSFEIRRGEFFSILGPSGCGKTTTLRLLAGFEDPDPDGGEVRLLGEVVNGRRPLPAPARHGIPELRPCFLISRSSGTWRSAWSSGDRRGPRSARGFAARWSWSASPPTPSGGAWDQLWTEIKSA